MNRREITPTNDASVIGVSEPDRKRDVEAFFAAHPFDADRIEELPADAFFRRFLDAPASTGGRR